MSMYMSLIYAQRTNRTRALFSNYMGSQRAEKCGNLMRLMRLPQFSLRNFRLTRGAGTTAHAKITRKSRRARQEGPSRQRSRNGPAPPLTCTPLGFVAHGPDTRSGVTGPNPGLQAVCHERCHGHRVLQRATGPR